MLASLALAMAQSTAFAPYESLGRRYLAAAGSAQLEATDGRASVLSELEHLHARFDLGFLEVWVPEVVIDANGASVPAPPWNELRRYVELCVQLEAEWIDRILAPEQDREGARDRLERIGAWLRSSKSSPGDERPQEVRDDANALAQAMLGESRRSDQRPPILILAPRRSHFVAWIGATSILEPWAHDLRQDASLARLPSFWTARDVTVQNLQLPATGDGADPLADFAPDKALPPQWIVHGTSHALAGRFLTNVPGWLLESTAMHDTITLAKADETLCSGCAPQVLDELSQQVLRFYTNSSSPFRDGSSSRWFARPLSDARSKLGFTIRSLEGPGESVELAAPFLGTDPAFRAKLPALSIGLQKGFSETFRAYTAAFAHWLDGQRADKESLLDHLLRNCRTRKVPPGRDPLRETLRQITGKTLGLSTDPKLDLEAQFLGTIR